MKKSTHYLLFIFLLTYQLCISQTETIHLGVIIDITEQMQNDDSDTLVLNIDSDPESDIRIISWTGHTIGTETVVSIEVLNNFILGLKTRPDYYDYLSGCVPESEIYNSNFGFILNSDQNTLPFSPIENFPIRLTNESVTQYGFISIEFTGEILRIKDYTFNNDGSDINCMGSLGVEGLEIDHLKNESFEYYNLMGQRIEHPSGMVLKVFDSGRTERVYIR